MAKIVVSYRELNQQYQELSEDHATAKDGTRALLRFVHARHRLDTKFDPGTLRGVLQNMDLGG